MEMLETRVAVGAARVALIRIRPGMAEATRLAWRRSLARDRSMGLRASGSCVTSSPLSSSLEYSAAVRVRESLAVAVASRLVAPAERGHHLHEQGELGGARGQEEGRAEKEAQVQEQGKAAEG